MSSVTQSVGTSTAARGRAGTSTPLWARLVTNHVFVLVGGLVVVVLMPALIDFRSASVRIPIMLGSSVEVLAAFVSGVFVLQRMVAHPGATDVRYVLPVLTATYGAVIAFQFFTRGQYSGQQILVSYVAALCWCYLLYSIGRRYVRPSFAIVPVNRGGTLRQIGGADWAVLDKPELGALHVDAVVADLHADLGPEWEAFLARTALSGVPVHHATQIQETMTGRVQIDHLSENVIGSLIPSTIYARCKRLLDLGLVLIVLPAAIPLMAVTAMMIRLESPGPAIFRQKRVGYRGRRFTIYKFRTMYADWPAGQNFTSENDPRVTPMGRVLRKLRLDELPQILNIAHGEMSWIGPRPEAVPLSEWYEREIPFFAYRHIVRPGISGWAQVQQGYAAEIDGVTEKLHYDFYYIKNFSLWLDLLIAAKTVRTFLTGFGAR